MKKLIAVTMAGYLLFSLCNLPFLVTPASHPATPTRSTVPTETSLVTATFTPSPIPAATWARQGPGIIAVPIILYHHIGVSPTNSRFYVSAGKFEEQIALLYDRGYTTISTETLVTAIKEGAGLPAHPIIITFDDGNTDNYTTAFPIMQEYGFSGVLYIVGSYIGADQYMNANQIKEMAAAGWEVGSHGMSHSDLTLLDQEKVRYEVIDSKKYLEKTLGVPVHTIAYPFGNSTNQINDYAYAAGYIAGMSLGSSSSHGSGNLYVLQRLDINAAFDINRFSNLLP